MFGSCGFKYLYCPKEKKTLKPHSCVCASQLRFYEEVSGRLSATALDLDQRAVIYTKPSERMIRPACGSLVFHAIVEIVLQWNPPRYSCPPESPSPAVLGAAANVLSSGAYQQPWSMFYSATALSLACLSECTHFHWHHWTSLSCFMLFCYIAFAFIWLRQYGAVMYNTKLINTRSANLSRWTFPVAQRW